MDVLKRIVELRNKRSWTEYELAKNSGLPQSTISSWYRNNMLPSLTSLEKICNGFSITLSAFFCEAEDVIDLTPSQKKLLDQYNSLTKSQKEKLEIFLDGMTTK